MILLFIMKRRCSSGTPPFKIRTDKLRGGTVKFHGEFDGGPHGGPAENDLEISLLLK